MKVRPAPRGPQPFLTLEPMTGRFAISRRFALREPTVRETTPSREELPSSRPLLSVRFRPNKKPLSRFFVLSGANDRNRTGDLLLTMELLYHLSYIGFLAERYLIYLISQAKSIPLAENDFEPFLTPQIISCHFYHFKTWIETFNIVLTVQIIGANTEFVLSG
jgi:hypothetical protein